MEVGKPCPSLIKPNEVGARSRTEPEENLQAGRGPVGFWGSAGRLDSFRRWLLDMQAYLPCDILSVSTDCHGAASESQIKEAAFVFLCGH